MFWWFRTEYYLQLKKIMKFFKRPLLIVGGVFLFSILFRLKDLNNFLEENKDNVISCFDCFFYARISKSLLENDFFLIDYLRNVPDFVSYKAVPSLMVFFPYILSYLSGQKIEIFFALLPPVLSVLFVIPLYFWIREFGNVHIFLGGAILGIFNLIYFNRTDIGRFDTDSLILFFVFLILLFLTKSVYNKKYSYIYVVISAILFNIFMFWYPKPIFSLFFVVSLLLGLMYAKNNIKDIFFKISLFILIAGPSLFFNSLYKIPMAYIKGYILKVNSPILPFSLTANISELKGISFNQFVMFTTDNPVTAFLSLVGLLLLFWNKRKYMLLAVPFIALGLSSFLAGNRFIIYLAPFLGMGLGYLIYTVFNALSNHLSFFRRKSFYIFSVVLVLFFSFPPQRIYAETSPILTKEVWESLKEVSSSIRKDSYLWSWWDYGYILQYTLGCGTYTDNGNIHLFKSYLFAHSMMTYDENISKNIIAFATNNRFNYYGKNIKSIEDTLKVIKKIYTYNELPDKQVYIFLFPGIMLKSIIHNLGVFGTGIYDEEVPSVTTFQQCEEKEKDFYDCGIVSVKVNNNGNFQIHWKNFSLKSNPPYKEAIFINRESETKETFFKNENYPKNRFLQVVYSKNGVYFIIANYMIKDSILNRMFIMKDKFRNFSIVYDNFPHLIVYKVDNWY